jgi:hypothetical protein
MTNRLPKSSKPVAVRPTDYAPLLAEIKARVQSARIKAGLAANRELLALYWDIGRLILDRQRKEGWGARVIDRLSVDLQREFPGQQGFSPRNLKYMRAFAEAWPETVIVQQPVAQLTKPRKPESVIVHQPGAQLGEPQKSERAIVQAPLAQTAQPVPEIVQRPVARLEANGGEADKNERERTQLHSESTLRLLWHPICTTFGSNEDDD